MICAFLIAISPLYGGQSCSRLRVLFPFILIKMFDISQEVVVARYLQQRAVLNVFQNRFSSGDICIISIRLTHIAVHEIHALTVCRRNVIENKRQHLVVKMKDLPEKDLQSK